MLSRNGKRVAPQRSVKVTAVNPLAVCKPRGDRVVVRRDMARDRTDGGILFTDAQIESGRRQLATVISVGPGARLPNGKRILIDLEPGDRVIISGYAGLDVSGLESGTPDSEYLILREDDISATL